MITHKVSVEAKVHHHGAVEVLLMGDVLVPCDTPIPSLDSFSDAQLIEEVRRRLGLNWADGED